ncbi:MAG: hypothetical protein ABSH20_13280 [Tepidisphaeraceae bacterium]|jgi:hypothetical protein
MRPTLLVAGIVLMAGCASRPTERAAVRPAYVDNPSSALVFDPPVMQGRPAVFLARDDRQPGAFVGFEDLSTTSFFIQTDDRPGDFNENWMYRRAMTIRSGLSYR